VKQQNATDRLDVKLPMSYSLRDQLRNNLATLAISIACLVGVVLVALKPPAEEIRRFSRQLSDERATFAAKAAEDDRLVLNNQNQLRDAQQELLRVERALSDTEETLRQTQTALAEFTAPKKSAGELREEKLVSSVEDNARLKRDLQGVRDAYVAALKKLQADGDAYRITSEGLARERKSLDDVSTALKILKGELSTEHAHATAKRWQDYLPPNLFQDEVTVGAAQLTPGNSEDDEFNKTLASDNQINIQHELQKNSQNLKRTVDKIRELETGIRNCDNETVDLQREITACQEEIEAFRGNK
jgi:uncharacterized protein HemX